MIVSIYYLVLVATFILSLINSTRKGLPNFRMFLFFSLLFESLAIYGASYGNNLLVTNVYSVFSVLYYLHVFKLKSRNFILIICYFLYSLLLFYLVNPEENFHAQRYNSGMLISVFLIFFYFYKLVFSKDYKPLGRIPKVYFGFGILLFYCCSFPILLFAEIFTKSNLNLGAALFDLVQIGNCFLYLGYLLSVLCQSPMKI